MKRLMWLVALFCVPLFAQTVEEKETTMVAYVPPQLQIEGAPNNLQFANGQNAMNVAFRAYQIVTFSATSDVRIFVRTDRDMCGLITWNAGSWQNATGRSGCLNQTWQEVAVRNGDVREFNGTFRFSYNGTQAMNIALQWQYKITEVQ